MKDNLVKISLNEIDAFNGHPFLVSKDDSLIELARSIKENGLLNPMIVRKKDNNRYEMISGYQKKAVLEFLIVGELEVIIRNFEEETSMCKKLTFIVLDDKILATCNYCNYFYFSR